MSEKHKIYLCPHDFKNPRFHLAVKLLWGDSVEVVEVKPIPTGIGSVK